MLAFTSGTIRVNRNYYSFLQEKSGSAQVILNFALAHEFADHMQNLYSRYLGPQDTVGGYSWTKLTDTFQREVYPHAHIDCLALSLMKNAKIIFDLKQIEEALVSIKDECVEYRGYKFCTDAHEARLEHLKKWFESIADQK